MTARLFCRTFPRLRQSDIIEHGQGYLSLLAGLEEVDCELGQMLLAGEPVGQMPESGDARLYVELRKDNHPVNPLTWIEK